MDSWIHRRSRIDYEDIGAISDDRGGNTLRVFDKTGSMWGKLDGRLTDYEGLLSAIRRRRPDLWKSTSLRHFSARRLAVAIGAGGGLVLILTVLEFAADFGMWIILIAGVLWTIYELTRIMSVKIEPHCVIIGYRTRTKIIERADIRCFEFDRKRVRFYGVTHWAIMVTNSGKKLRMPDFKEGLIAFRAAIKETWPDKVVDRTP
ncbi:MAG: hypothetical protein JSU65_06510 [Candidatus Zixiibacteriota bacterium]|nr:MAG: hypothetical protein JSU65_06510 [candidate division Zixibacteria bacterium]